MSGSQSLVAFEPDAYESIEQAMMESGRGRWFLSEHARRNRGPDTAVLLDAIARLEGAVTTQRQPDDLGHLRGSLLDMAKAISRTKAEIVAISPDHDQSRLGVASEALDAIVRTTERATTDILGAAEAVQETAWILRERGVDPPICDQLDQNATTIYTACSFQDLTAQRTSRVIHTLRYLEERVAAMIGIWVDEADHIPEAPEGASAEAPADLCQSDVDRFIFVDTGAATEEEAAGEPEEAPHAEAPAEAAVPADQAEAPHAEAEPATPDFPEAAASEPVVQLPFVAPARTLDDIDRLSVEEKLALFS